MTNTKTPRKSPKKKAFVVLKMPSGKVKPYLDKDFYSVEKNRTTGKNEIHFQGGVSLVDGTYQWSEYSNAYFTPKEYKQKGWEIINEVTEAAHLYIYDCTKQEVMDRIGKTGCLGYPLELVDEDTPEGTYWDLGLKDYKDALARHKAGRKIKSDS